MLVYAWEVNEKSDHSTPTFCVNSSAFYLKMIVGACNTQELMLLIFNASSSSKAVCNDYHLSMEKGSLFVLMRSTKLCSWCLWKALDEEGCMGLVP
jgi:hypothetical protein